MSAPTRVTSVDYSNSSHRVAGLGQRGESHYGGSRGVPLISAGDRSSAAARVHFHSVPVYDHYHVPVSHHYSSLSTRSGKLCCENLVVSIAMIIVGLALALFIILFGTVEGIPLAIGGVALAVFGGVFTWVNCSGRRI